MVVGALISLIVIAVAMVTMVTVITMTKRDTRFILCRNDTAAVHQAHIAS